MASIVVRGLDDAVKRRLAERARNNGRSMEAEARSILAEATMPANIGLALFEAAQAMGGVDDLPIPERSDIARAVDFE
jgi:plasmid stability protein